MSAAPKFLDAFTARFTSRYVHACELRMHAVIGGDGAPPLLVHGCPQAWYAWRMLIPAPARDFEVIAVDPRGIALSDKVPDGYDTGTLTGDLVALMDALGHTRFALYETDTGMPIAYKFRRLTVSVLAIGGAESTGEGLAGTMRCAAAEAQSVVLADCGHWVAEQGPEELLAPPTAFLASYRNGAKQGVGDRPEDSSTASTTVIEDMSIRPEGDPDV